MRIDVVTSKGEGSTLLAAFDHALQNCGVSNYNLIVLSSIIPRGSELRKIEKYQAQSEEFGHRLYVVKADQRCDKIGRAIAAGIGWYQFEDGRGIFVEHETEGENEQEVRSIVEQRIHHTLKDMCKYRHVEFDESKLNSAISTISVTRHPACALAIAVYQSQKWE